MKPYPFMTHPLGIAARSLARRLGIVRILAPLLRSQSYEEAFSAALLTETRPGDCVWDVGANVGHYTAQFERIVGPLGRVFAFEPSPRSQAKLRMRFANGNTNVQIVPMALGASNTKLPFAISDEETGVTDQIALDASMGPSTGTYVDVRTGDALVRSGLPYPTLIKIDVEGFELDVLRGLDSTLKNELLRAVYVEIHFGALERRGIVDGPRKIEEMFISNGFQISWLDHSHLVARRQTL